MTGDRCPHCGDALSLPGEESMGYISNQERFAIMKHICGRFYDRETLLTLLAILAPELREAVADVYPRQPGEMAE